MTPPPRNPHLRNVPDRPDTYQPTVQPRPVPTPAPLWQKVLRPPGGYTTPMPRTIRA